MPAISRLAFDSNLVPSLSKHLFNRLLGLVENNNTVLSNEDIDRVVTHVPDRPYPTFVKDTFNDIYFTAEENEFIDRSITNINTLDDTYRRALAFFALCQACIVKRPYNLFHRKNLYIRFAKVQRSFGNKTSWDRPFPEWIRLFAHEANTAVFSGTSESVAINKDIFEVNPGYDLVYIDPPYTSGNGVAVDYADFYHFLEGLAAC